MKIIVSHNPNKCLNVLEMPLLPVLHIMYSTSTYHFISKLHCILQSFAKVWR